MMEKENTILLPSMFQLIHLLASRQKLQKHDDSNIVQYNIYNIYNILPFCYSFKTYIIIIKQMINKKIYRLKNNNNN